MCLAADFLYNVSLRIVDIPYVRAVGFLSVIGVYETNRIFNDLLNIGMVIGFVIFITGAEIEYLSVTSFPKATGAENFAA